MENQKNELANSVCTGVIANPEHEFHYVTGSLRRYATSMHLPTLAEHIASSRTLQVHLGHEVAACKKDLLRVQAATWLSVTCNPGAAALLKLQAMVDAELARRAIDGACLG